MMPPWLRAHLEATGAANPDGYARVVRAGGCTQCGARILRGLDGARAALPADVDPEPISAVGEVLALLVGAHTFNICNPTRPELAHRTASHIAGPRRYPVLAEHRCGTVWPNEENQHE